IVRREFVDCFRIERLDDRVLADAPAVKIDFAAADAAEREEVLRRCGGREVFVADGAGLRADHQSPFFPLLFFSPPEDLPSELADDEEVDSDFEPLSEELAFESASAAFL